MSHRRRPLPNCHLWALLLMLGWLLPGAGVAEFAPVTDPAFQVTLARPVFDRRNRAYLLDVTVTHTGSVAAPGSYRLVVASANKTAISPDGTTAAKEPFYDLLTGDGATFAAGATMQQRLSFTGQRGQLVATLRLERDAPPPPANEPPTADAGADQTLTLAVGESTVLVTLDGSASSDADGSVIGYAWTGAPQPAAVAAPQVLLPVGVHVFTLVVTDDQGAVSDAASVTITVNPAPDPEPEPDPSPPLLQVEPDSASVDGGGLLTIAVAATDPDGDLVTLTASPALPNARFTATPAVDPSGVFSFTPAPGQVGRFQVQFTARDRHGLTDARVVEIVVNPVNTAPALTVATEHEVPAGGLLTIPIDASDPDGDPLSLTASGLPDNAVLLAARRQLVFAPALDQRGVFDLTLSVSDGIASRSAPVRISVTPPPTGGGTAAALDLVVDPPATPSLLPQARITGAVNGASAPRPAATPFALITGLAPVNARQGERLTVLVTGPATGRWATRFAADVTSADFGAGVGVEAVRVLSATSAEVDIAVAAGAAPGVREVRLTSGAETAVSVLAFRIERGEASVAGVLRGADNGAPIAGAVISIEGTNLRVVTDADGRFSLTGVPSGEQTLLINAPNHDLLRTTISAVAGTPLELAELTATPNVLPPGAPPSASVLSLVQRGIGDPTRPLTREAAQALVRDALMLVGGVDIGIIDADGNQQNPEVGDDVPFFGLSEATVATIAERMLTTERRTLGEVLYDHVRLWDWDGPAPTLVEWLAALQTLVDQAWANPRERRYALLFLLFNPTRGLAPTPPTIVADLPLDALQVTLMELTLLRFASRSLDPEALHDAIVIEFPELADHRGPGSGPAERSGLLARLLDHLLPPAHAASTLRAAAERAAYQIHVREKLSLAAREDVNLGFPGLAYQWELIGRPAASSGTVLTRADERIAYLSPNASGDYRLRLTVSATGQTAVSTEVVVTAGDLCDQNFSPSLANADATWEELACVFSKTVPKGLTQGALTGQFWGWLKGSAPISSYDAKLLAANQLKGFNITNGIGYPPGKITAMKALEKAMPDMLKRAEAQAKTVQYAKFSTRLLMSSTAGFIQGQAAQISRDIMYTVLDKTVLAVIDSVRPAPPTEVSATPVTSEAIQGGVAVAVIFDRSPSHQAWRDAGADSDAPDQHYYYKIYRERSGGVLERIYVGPEALEGPLRAFRRDGDGRLLLTYIDAAPPEGQLAYYVSTRRIVGSKQVTTETWNEGQFWAEQIVGVLSPPGLNQYSFAKAMSDRGLSILKAVKLQDSDLSLPARLYVPRSLDRLKLPVTLAATPVAGPYHGEILMSVPELDTVFTFDGGAVRPLLNSGYAAPFMSAMAVDSFGHIYLSNGASEQRFGGRIFRWNRELQRELFGSVQYFSQLLMYSRPVAVRGMTAGWMKGSERLYIADAISDTLRELHLFPDGGLPNPPGRYVSQPITSPGQVTIGADVAMTVNDAEAELLVADGANLFRYAEQVAGSGVASHLFAFGESPFTQIGGIDADADGTLYVTDSATGELLVIPATQRNPAFYAALKDEPWRRALYTLAADLPEPGEVRVAGHQHALIWLDTRGLRRFGFGFSGRLVDTTGAPLASARVSVGERGDATEVLTDQHGVFRLSGLRGPGLTDAPSLLVRSANGEVGQFRILLNQIGHTFAERMEFVPIRPPAPDDPPPPQPGPVPPEIRVVKPGETEVIEIAVGIPPPLPVIATAPVVEILSPANGLETDQPTVSVQGFVLGGTVLGATLEVNGSESPLTITDGRFSTTVPVGGNLTQLRVYVEALDGESQPVVGRSRLVLVYPTDSPSTGALVGQVTDQVTGLPVPGVTAIAAELGISALSDRNGVWRLDRVPPGQVTLELVP
jgi:hypothetical protein